MRKILKSNTYTSPKIYHFNVCNSVVLMILTLLHNHHHSVQIFGYLQTELLYPFNNNFPYSPFLPAPGKPSSTLCPYECAFVDFHIGGTLCLSFCVWLIWLSLMFSRFFHAVPCTRTSFLFMFYGWIIFCCFVCNILFIHLSTDWYWIISQLWATVNNGTKNIIVQVPIFNSSEYLLWTTELSFIAAASFYIPINNVWVLFLYILTHTWYFPFFF